MPSIHATVAALVFGSSISVANAQERLIVKNGCSTDDIWIASSDNVPGGPVVQIKPGQQIKYNIPYGLASTRFWPKMYCNGAGQECLIGDSGGPGQTCAEGGCAPPVDSKFEATWGKADGDCATDAHSCDWWDTSGVDGFTLPYKIELSDSCKARGGVEIDCSRLSLDHCPTSEEVQNVGNVDLTLRHPSNQQVVGCYSPCAKLTTSNWDNPLGTHSPPDNIANPYCCPTPPVSSEQCRSGPADSMGYTKLIHAQCPHVYGYAYDDAVGLQTCPQDTVYTWTLYCPDGGSPTPVPPPPAPTPSPPPSGSCSIGDVVACPNSANTCAGNQCCADGSTCPSADESFSGCPSAKAFDCTHDPYTPSPSPEPVPGPSPASSGSCCWGGSTCDSARSCHADAFCGASEEQCTGPCNGVWCAQVAAFV